MSSALAHSAGSYTLADWESLDHDSDGNRVELIGGHFHVTPAPGFTHQSLSDELRFELRAALLEHDRTDLVAVSAIGVAVTQDMGFIPDIVVVPVPPATVKAAPAPVELDVDSLYERIFGRCR